jgi:chromosome segregation protein
VTAPARLLGLRVQGFKSFAERTLVEFGPGISAVVGPNGSGKSNLADALRWALGEQGRSLRIRKSEDVIWAGSEKRSAQGMADVTLVIDNADGLLPVEYSVLELGRRLYRSGENDYLLNRQRVRLRDLQDLLDAANLADNAFLFIGQGMVDQALALRPEERRPLFEEVAGVRRHERRRRKAEEQLAEAEGNLARVEDILAELRPQARRLGQLAEQQATRLTAGEELAAALIAAAHGRWHEAAGRAALADRRRDELRAETGHALEALETAESTVTAIAASMAARAEAEREQRGAHEAARAAVTTLGLREARAAGEIQAAARDRERISVERVAGEADLAAHRRILAEAVPERDLELEATLGEADRALGEALAELGSL